MSKIVRLTTTDNPHDPVNDFGAWWDFDHMKGYNSSERLAAWLTSSADLPSEMQEEIQEEAIDEIVSLNLTGVDTKFVLEV